MKQAHDFVIVGAGSAGCVLAGRLSEDPSARVLLIEAGPPDTANEIHVPALLSRLFKTRHDWDYDTDPEPGLDGRIVYLPRGRVLGGSSSLNAMIYTRGNRIDYEAWKVLGCEGWGWEEVLPYFLRAEDNERGASELHGAGGPLSVSDGRSRHPLSEVWLEAAEQAGLQANSDFNGAVQDGVGHYQLTQRNGMRCSAALAFLRPALARPNLEIITGALAVRIIFEGRRATGVEVEHEAELKMFRAEREVILAAGAYDSPKLLLLSGVGPALDLARWMIHARADLPVGRNLQDHPAVWLRVLVNTDSLLAEVVKPESLELLRGQGRGPLSSNGAEIGGFWRSADGLPAPDIQFHASPLLLTDQLLGVPNDHACSWGPCLLTPASRGTVSLRSADPSAKARILHNYYAEAVDLDAMVRATRMAMQIAAQPAMRAVTRGRAQPYPGSTETADIMSFIRQRTQTMYHPVGTCAMGSVVDSELRVLGFEGLRVVDASVMPTIVRGNANAPAMMIAERAADLVLGRTPARAPAAVKVVEPTAGSRQSQIMPPGR